MISDNIEAQRLQIQINNLQGDGQSTDRTILPYDPSAPPDSDSTTIVLAQNFLDNSDFDYSKNGYIASGSGDADYECYNFFRQRFIKSTDVVTTAASNVITSASNPFKAAYTYPMDFVLLNGGASGTALVGYIDRNTSDGSAKLYSDVGLVTPLNVTPTLTAATLWFGETLSDAGGIQALKSVTHSLYAANEAVNLNIPRWDRTNGWVEIGSNASDKYDLATPLPINLIRAGVTFYVRCILSQRSGTSGSGPVRLSAGIWDATTGRQRFLESSNLDLSVTVVGTTEATGYTYLILADLDDGRTIVSDTVTVANGNATLSTANYNRLEWQNATGVIRFRIYRSTGGIVKKVFTITNGAHDFNDYGNTDEGTVGSLPTAGEQRPIAYAVTGEIDPQTIDGWQTVSLTLPITDSYNASTTTGKQWLRIQVEGTTAQERMVLLDRISLSTSNGGWNRSSRDLAKIATGVPSSTPTDGGGQGGGGIDDGRDGECFVYETPVIVCDRDGTNLRRKPIGDIKAGEYVFSGARRVFKVKNAVKGHQPLIKVTLSNGVSFTCSPSERVITSRADKKGTRIDALTLGDDILCWNNGRVSTATIEGYESAGTGDVKTLLLNGGHTFVVGEIEGKSELLCGAIVHNVKILE
jgi:hypothetical protein